MTIEQVQNLLRTGHRFPPLSAIAVLASPSVVWDEKRGALFRTQIGQCSYSVAVIDADHLEVLCLDRAGHTDVVSITRRVEARQEALRRRSGG